MHLLRTSVAVAAFAVLVPPAFASAGTSAVPPDTRRPPRSTVPAAPLSSPANPLAGELFTVSGNLGANGKRTVQLQKRAATGAWTTSDRAATSSRGRYTFTTSTRTPTTMLRVLAPRTGTARETKTPPAKVVLATDTTTLALGGDRRTATATGTLLPVRPGRLVRLQRSDKGWHTVATTRQGTAPGVSWQLADLSGLPRNYRILTGAWKGANNSAGQVVAFTPAPVASGLPRLRLTTAGAAPVVSKETYLDGTLQVGDEPAVTMTIKGRGNGTWVLPKKPYRLKLTAKKAVLGLPAEKDFALLANLADRTLLRNRVAFDIAEQTSLGAVGWTPQSRFVDVTLNGVDLGTYQLTEQVEESADKVQLAAGGLLLEIDTRYQANGDPGFTSAHGTPIGYKDPDDPSVEDQAAVLASVDAFETALYGEEFLDPESGYAKYVDLTSFADWYLVNEFMRNIDADFYSSTFVSWDPVNGGRFTMGPVWDFDHSSGWVSALAPGCCLSTSGWWLRGEDPTGRLPSHANHWFTRMVQDPAFADLLATRWNTVVSPAVGQALAGLPAQQAAIAASAELDWLTWHTGDTPRPENVHGTSQAAEEEFFADWLVARRAWMDAEFS